MLTNEDKPHCSPKFDPRYIVFFTNYMYLHNLIIWLKLQQTKNKFAGNLDHSTR